MAEQALTRLTAMQTLDLSHNMLTGTVPTWALAQAMGRLDLVDLSHNMLSGSVPLGLAYVKSLDLLRVDSNRFSGALNHVVPGTNVTTAELLRDGACASRSRPPCGDSCLDPQQQQ